MDKLSDVRNLTGAGFSHGLDAVAQTIIVNSIDRVEGVPAAYDVTLSQRLNEVFAVSMRSFTGSITPYNIPVPSAYMIVSSIGGFTHYDTTFFLEGEYSLESLLEILNSAQTVLRFQVDTTTRKVICSRLVDEDGLYTLGLITAGDSDGSYGFSGVDIIGSLIGFPSGIRLDPGVNAVQSTLPVLGLTTLNRSLLISINDISNGMVTTGNISGCFNIPLTPTNYNPLTKLMQYQEGSEFEQIARVNNTSLTTVRIKILDAVSGQMFRAVGDHSIVLTFYQTKTK